MTKPSIKAAILFPILLISVAICGTALFRLNATPPWRSSVTTAPVPKQLERKKRTTSSAGTPFTFITYNVRNWLVSSQSPLKKPESKEAVVRILAEANPDVIGLCEVGGKKDVEEIRLMLVGAGCELPYTHHTGGVDAVRHLALLSRFPIVSTESPTLKIPRKWYSMQRGMLDATIRIGAGDIRFIGLHLKSKRAVPEFDQALLRIDEAWHVRKHLDAILANEDEALVIAYGDFNDTTRSLSTRAIFGNYRTPGYMSPVHVKDTRGESWTHCWDYQDIYTRIDFVTVSGAMQLRVDKAASRVIDDTDWEIASDHRAVLVRFK